MEKRTRHIDEDKLLKYVLETLEPAEDTEVERHLRECQACSDEITSMMADIASIKALEVSVETPPIPFPSTYSRDWRMVLGAAALIIVGFGLGVLTRSVSNNRDITLYSMAAPHQTITTQSGNHSTCISDNLSIYLD
ncbi:MAG: zf-HC2 domain-containing protein [FCB group bacterium]|nr:zf-HC2 domain-containing protein [FCB group bacterium]MBL7029215.1 zf-HC2 domain-containing protein [Candidatus Neomarinimicrobiota bacterium]MBL7121129.1 zf-HC2 domain-containing protein [Candidatus Neomarinimicrobiota bacterium]